MRPYREQVQKNRSLGTALLFLAVLCLADFKAQDVAQGKQNAMNPVNTKEWKTYSDTHRQFRINYPREFVFRQRKATELDEFVPTPETVIYFMSPSMASGDLAGIEPPDLEIRIYPVNISGYSLEQWLRATGFAYGKSGTTVRRFQSTHVDGLEVCSTTMIAPGCSMYVMGINLIFQLTPASEIGQMILETFGFDRNTK